METFMELMQNSDGTIDLDANEFNFGAMPHEQEQTSICRGFSPLEDGKQEQEQNKEFQLERGYFIGVSMARNQ
jgi:hypothetical protein